jgi:predicted metalloprotease with PDZ domain
VAHEFFHAWNVERMRPAALEPFDYEKVNMSGELWFAEGFTSYYTNLILRRAGLIDTPSYAVAIGGGISTVNNSPGRNYRSPVEMSMHAPFVDRAVSIDPNNHGNTFISYYTWGSVVGLALDLSLRRRFGAVGLSLDAYMRAAWEQFGATETPYTVDDLEGVLADLTGDPAFAEEFFDLYVRGRTVPDFSDLLAPAGMVVRQSNPDRAWIGSVGFTTDGGGAVVSGYTQVGSPLYDAGVDRGDQILAVNGANVMSRSDLTTILADLDPGDDVTIRFASRGTEQEATVSTEADPRLEVVLFEQVERPLTREIEAFRASWLDGTR